MEIDMDIVLMQDIIETEPIHHDVQQRARTPACSIPKGLEGHDPAKRWIKEINKGGDIIFKLLHHVLPYEVSKDTDKTPPHQMYAAQSRVIGQLALLLQPIGIKWNLLGK